MSSKMKGREIIHSNRERERGREQANVAEASWTAAPNASAERTGLTRHTRERKGNETQKILLGCSGCLASTSEAYIHT
jgi:hypothetical protein